jgi:prophage regulatory protein
MENSKTSDKPDTMLRLAGVEGLVGLRKSTLYRLIQEGKFPRGIRLSARATAWSLKDVSAWIEARKAEGAAK